ncbi:hypothetical protein CFE70_007805 [Pyrenophora teres f. teres 0-1]|uniref:Uncharacterized protein n=2 Tax=Pyrenophora teres f. teres TaxID=97479 RepID=E3RNV5_PYRTT|nr:hypothetical protein PTT_10271 [Pyrenophora teres f. teres 0-1]KAE8834315.1 hypothetical protein PTNB85_05648 [Pyrenophora teres f. teres]KAE8844202.1 hypothetical protein HRS9122_05305 [Pyrenophora teres f. teres]KAE8858738.1 hypothetical protein PTNB73_08218 [Pyrenophora teres f. teres]KAE8860603.1 hypothetical protein PTNB29_05698 [Pyrenophora teres f. teres]
MPIPDSTYSGFLSLPTEIRCHIYDYLLSEPQAVTVSAGYLTCSGNRILDTARNREIPGLPTSLTPVARRGHDKSLLAFATPPTIPIDHGRENVDDDAGEKLGFPAPVALLLTSHLINDEMADCMRRRKRLAEARSKTDADGVIQDDANDKEGLTLYVSYPYGVLVLKSLYPYLLKQARRVYVSGYYTPPGETEPLDTNNGESLTPDSSLATTSFNTPASGPSPTLVRPSSNSARRPARPGQASNPAPRPRLRVSDMRLPSEIRQMNQIRALFPSFSSSTSEHAPAALADLILTVFSKNPTPLTKFTARILFPGENTYGSVWGDDNSPVTHILRNMSGGKIDMKVLRGALGTGLRLTARPKRDTRIVSTSWVNWKKGLVPRGRRGNNWVEGKLGTEDLDTFLVGDWNGA